MGITDEDKYFESDLKKVIMLNSQDGAMHIDTVLTIIYVFFAKRHKTDINNLGLRAKFVEIGNCIHRLLKQDEKSNLSFDELCPDVHNRKISRMDMNKKITLLKSLSLNFIHSIENNGYISFNCECTIPNSILGEPIDKYIWHINMTESAVQDSNVTLGKDNDTQSKKSPKNKAQKANDKELNDAVENFVRLYNELGNKRKENKSVYFDDWEESQIKCPRYAWQWNFTADEYSNIKKLIEKHTEFLSKIINGNIIACKLVQLCISEWYKREYNGNEEVESPIKIWKLSAKKICENTKIKVYQEEDEEKKPSENRWQDSIYVNGGLPLCYYCSKESDLRRNVKKIIKGKEDKPDFNNQVLDQSYNDGSIHDFVESVVINDTISIDGFENFKTIIKEERNQLFETYWHISYSRQDRFPLMSRTLEIIRKPGPWDGDGNLRCCLPIEYLRKRNDNVDWDNMNMFHIALRFNEDKGKTSILWTCRQAFNGNFICGASANSIEYKDDKDYLKDIVNSIEIIAVVDGNKQIVLQKIETDIIDNDYVQLYKEESRPYFWTDKTDNKVKTILLYNKEKYEIVDDNGGIQRQFEGEILSNIYYFVKEITTSITLKSKYGKQDNLITFYCKNEGVRIGFKKCTNIEYLDDAECLVKRIQICENEEGEEYTCDGSVPLIGGKNWITVTKYSKDKEQNETEDITKTAKIDFKYTSDKGKNWTEWTADNEPEQGFILIRAQHGQQNINNDVYEVYYLPAISDKNIVVRNVTSNKEVDKRFDSKTICFKNGLKDLDKLIKEGRFFCGKEEFENVIFRFGSRKEYIEISVFPPFNIRLVISNGKRVATYNNDQFIEIPYILRKDITIKKIDENGTSLIDLGDKKEEMYGLNLYKEMDTNADKKPEEFRNEGNIKYYMWKNIWDRNDRIEYKITANAKSDYRFFFCILPEFKVIELPEYIDDNYRKEYSTFESGLPKSIKEHHSNDIGFIFQSCKCCNPLFYSKYNKIGEWFWSKPSNPKHERKKKDKHKDELIKEKAKEKKDLIYLIDDKKKDNYISLLDCQIKCFNLSSDYHIPFRLFEPINELCKYNKIKDEHLINFYIEYCKANGNVLSSERIESFWFFAKSYYFDWTLLNPQIWGKEEYKDFRLNIFKLFQRIINCWTKDDMVLYWNQSDKDWRNSEIKFIERRTQESITKTQNKYLNWSAQSDSKRRKDIISLINK